MTLEQKLDKILDSTTEMKVELAKSIVHQENHAKQLLLHSKDLGDLKEYKNNSTGRNAVISVVSGGVFGGIMAWIGKHL